MTYLVASQLGCALDCDLSTGLNKYTGGPATDDAPRINAALAAATVNNPITLVLDGSALISGLFLPAAGHWSIAGQGCGPGFFIQTATNNDGIHNGDPAAAIPSDPGPYAPLPARGSSVSLSNFTLNGNQGNGSSGDSTTGAAQGNSSADLWYYGINLMNLDNIVISQVTVLNAPSYHIRLSNVGNVTVTGCVMKSTGPNTDGLHFDGPANDIAISNCDFTCQDDGIALNCPEGYTGNISRVAISDCTFNTNSLARLYTINANNSPFKFMIDTVTVTNCSGVFAIAGFMIGQGAGGAVNSVDGLRVTNCQFIAPGVLDVEVNFGSIVLTGVTLTPLNSNAPDGAAFLRTTGYFNGMTYHGASLTLENCVLARNSSTPVAAIIVYNGSTIDTVAFNGFALQDLGGATYPPASELIDFISGSIGQLILDNVDSTHLTASVSPNGFSNITSVLGTGVLATAWPFPDAVMANGSPYLSANSGRPSIKVAGVVQPYP